VEGDVRVYVCREEQEEILAAALQTVSAYVYCTECVLQQF